IEVTEVPSAEQNGVLRSRSTIPHDFYDYMATARTISAVLHRKFLLFSPSISYQLQNPATAV
ncbi:MAG: hypothetical protein IJV76_00380, partial [Clostridia bacterium]|nr:hypothetical protein [Clostridia bacterium]